MICETMVISNLLWRLNYFHLVSKSTPLCGVKITVSVAFSLGEGEGCAVLMPCQGHQLRVF